MSQQKKNKSVTRTFAGYVSQNILGMIGISLYILADTFFISKAEGANGITALNLVLPVYNLIFAIGAMLGNGSAIRFKVQRAKGEGQAELYFSNAIWAGLLLGGVFMLLGLFYPGQIVALMGGDAQIVRIGTEYTRIFMLFSPFFIWNYILNAFVRNDGAPTTAMLATIGSSLFNIVMDYVLMFPLGLGMPGAALATAVSPILGISICATHFLTPGNTVRFVWKLPSLRRTFCACQLGVSSFVGEFSSGVTTVVFNLLILSLAGNIGVAAYGVIANTSLIAVSVFNGLSQGCQPLLSEFYGKGAAGAVQKVLKLGFITSLCLAVILLFSVNGGADGIVSIFNSQRDADMAFHAVRGLRLYFLGFLFAGINIVGTGYLSAIESAGWAFLVSMLRGAVAIIGFAFLLSRLFGMVGVWLAFPASELLTMTVTLVAIVRSRRVIHR